MALEVRMVKTLRDLRAFVKVQFDIYRGNAYWIPPLLFDEYSTLRRDRNPAFDECEAEYWIAWKDGKAVGRIAGIINNPYIKKWGKKNARFGWIEFIEDFQVAEALIRTVEEYARSKGMEGIVGPMGFTDLDKEGTLIEGFSELGTLPMIYNHPWYPEYLERLGYAKDVDWLEFKVTCPEEIPEKVLRVNALVLKRSGVRIFEAKSPKDLERRYGKALFGLINEAYVDLYGTVEFTERQVKSYIKQYLGFVDTKYTKVLIDEHDRIVAFGIAFPSLSIALQRSRGRLFPFGWFHLLWALKHPVELDLMYIGVDKKYQGRGINALLMTEITRAGIENGVRTAETSGELEDNHAVQSLWKHYDARQHKRRRVYRKTLV